MINAQSYHIPLTVEQFTESSRNDFNEKVSSWSTFTTLWARRRFKALGETDRAKQLTSTDEVMYECRYSNVDTTMRIVSDGVTYQITKVEVLGRKESMVLTAIKKDSW
jgi:head-tail adaptor